jgi:uncharacterized protein YrrD
MKDKKLSELFGKCVEEKGGKVGYILGVIAENNKIARIVCADENEKRFFVPFCNLQSFGEKLIFEKATKTEKSERGQSAESQGKYKGRKGEEKSLRLGIPAFDFCGKYLGVLSDYLYEADTIKCGVIGGKVIPFSRLFVGDIVLVNLERCVKCDVVKGDEVLLKRGSPLSKSAIEKVKSHGEYIQTKLKSL